MMAMMAYYSWNLGCLSMMISVQSFVYKQLFWENNYLLKKWSFEDENCPATVNVARLCWCQEIMFLLEWSGALKARAEKQLFIVILTLLWLSNIVFTWVNHYNHPYYTLITSHQVSNYEKYWCPYSYCHDLASQNDYPLVKFSFSPLAFYWILEWAL